MGDSVPTAAQFEQALWDLVYVSRRSGARALGQFTLRNLEKLDRDLLRELAPRYPKTAARDIEAILGGGWSVSMER